MATNKTSIIPLATYPAGTTVIPSRNINTNVIAYGIEIARCTTATPLIWPDPASTIEIMIEVSFDNGNTWTGGSGWLAYGGIYVRRDGTEAAYSSNYQPIPAGNGRRVRLTAMLSHDIYTTATLVTYT